MRPSQNYIIKVNLWMGFSFLVFLITSCSSCGEKKFLAKALKNATNAQSSGRDYAVATQGKYTTKAAKMMIDQGGNLFDAFVAASFVISVERPHSSGLGGGGFALIKKSDEVKSYDFRERAPLRASSDMYLDPKSKEPRPLLSRTGIKAQAVPGLVKGLIKIHQEYGSLSLAKVLAPAIDLCEKGMPVYEALAKVIEDQREILRKNKDAAKIFFDPKTKAPLKVGEILYQKDLGQTIRLIAQTNGKSFYRGETAKKIVSYHQKNSGLIQSQDLTQYKVQMRPLVQAQVLGHQIYTQAPPSSGGVHIVQILKILEKLNYEKLQWNSVQSWHLMAEAQRLAFVDRAHHLGDPKSMNISFEKLISSTYLDKMSARIDPQKAMKSDELWDKVNLKFYESDHTTHLSLSDSQGNMIASTQTINGHFGSGEVITGTGIVANNEMDDFAQKKGAVNLFGAIGGDHNLVYPGRTPLSSMSPTLLIFPGGKKMQALGTPSGTRILTCVAQVMAHQIFHKLSPWQALLAPRIHHQWYPDYIRVEHEDALAKAIVKGLKNLGHDIKFQDLGCKVQITEYDFAQSKAQAYSDPREEAHALAW